MVGGHPVPAADVWYPAVSASSKVLDAAKQDFCVASVGGELFFIDKGLPPALAAILDVRQQQEQPRGTPRN